jgi:ATP-dependent protease ClpP protease subunit
MNAIYIQGEIGVDVMLEHVISQHNKIKHHDIITFYISSVGGYVEEGQAIQKFIESIPQRTIAQNIGGIASIASNIYLACDYRIFDITKGDFLIHNPWVEIRGDSDYLQKHSKELQKVENEIADYYSRKLNVDIDTIKSLMSKNDSLDGSTLKDLGICNELITERPKAVAKLNNNMNKEQFEQAFDEQKKSLVQEIVAKVKEMFNPKARIELADASGVVIVFPELEEGQSPEVGAQALINDEPANGSYLMPDGVTFVFENGVLSAIEPAEDNEMENLKKENEKLRLENDQLKEESAALSKKTEETVVKMVNLKLAEIKSKWEGGNEPQPKGKSYEQDKNFVFKF